MLLGLTYLEAAVDNLIYASLLENVSLSPHHLFFSSLNHKGPNYRGYHKKGENKSSS